MLIGIDASRAESDAPTGTENYSREMIRALLQIDSKNRYRLYTRRSSTQVDQLSRASPQSTITNSETRAIPFPRLWTHMRLSFEMLTNPPDLLWVPAHVLPPVHPKRSIVTIHDLGNLYFPEAYPQLQRAYHWWSQRWNAHSSAHIFADSQATKNDVQRLLRIAPEKITVVYPAYDASQYSAVRDLAAIEKVRSKLRVDKNYIISVGTINPRKNYARLVEAFERLRLENCQLLIVGKKGWMYREFLSKLGKLENRIRILDFISPEDLPTLVSGAMLSVVPSLHEGFGLPILEAQACGVPVICSNSSSLPEVAGEAAMFFDPLNIESISNAMQRGLNDAGLRSNLIERGLENVRRFKWEDSASIALGVMNRVGEHA